MSLVSYYDSDDSNDSGEESVASDKVNVNVQKTVQQQTTHIINEIKNSVNVSEHSIQASSTILSGHISDDEDDGPAPVETKKDIDFNLLQNAEETLGEGNFLHNNLPVPKTSLEASERVGLILNDQLEDEVRPKQSQMVDAPKPPPKRSRQPVKITIPKLSQDDEDEPTQKKMKIQPSKQKSGLFSLLPPPVHAAKKESNRILVPHTLTKKPPAKPAVNIKKTVLANQNEDVSVKKMTAFQAMTGYESDSDEENSDSGNFFSLEAEPEENKEHLKLSKDLPPCLPSASEILPEDLESKTVTSLPKIDVNPDAPLGFNKSYINPYVPPKITSAPSSSSSSDDATHNQYNTPYAQYEVYNNNYEETSDVNQTSEVDNYLQDEQFLRMQGKRQRGKEEINIIDANMNDFVNSNEIELTKTLTEESTHKSHRQKDNMPSSKEKRKHQITYLAFQAKEREFELKNAWAQGRVTKRQTQSKYGF